MLSNNYRSIKFNLLVKKVVCAAIMLIPTISMAVPLLKYQLDPGTTIATLFDVNNSNIDREEPLTGYFTVQDAGPDAPLNEIEETTFGHRHIFKLVDLFFQSESYELTKSFPESDETYNILAVDTCLIPPCRNRAHLLSYSLDGTGFNKDPGEAIILDASANYTGDQQSPERISSTGWPSLFAHSTRFRQIGIVRNFSATRVDPPIDAVPVPELSGSGMALGLGVVFGLFALMRERYRSNQREQ